VERAYRRAREIEPASIAAGVALAREMLRQKRAQEALDIGRGLLAYRREDGNIWSVIGWAEMQLGKPDEARQAFNEAAKADPWSREPHLGMLALTRARGDAAGVVFALQRLISTSPDDRMLWLQLAGAYMQVERYERALSAAEHMLKSAPDDADALLHKGNALFKLGRHREAIETLKQGLAGKPMGPAFGWVWLGNVYYHHKIYPEAIAAYRSALAYEKPGESFARANLGLALKDGRHLDEALAVFEKLRDERPDDPYAWRQVGYTLHLMGRLEAALPAYERALAIDPKEGKVWQAMVEVYHALGRRDDARRVYDRLRAVDAKRAEEAYKSILITYEDGK
jgi:tetratricopeptide (TPR) repeat protein